MTRSVRVHLAPALVAPSDLSHRTVLVIDLLRASTTICHALAAGAKDVAPFVDVEEVRRAASEARQRGETVICGGERGGRRIDGFDLGNSPREYTPDVVSGRRVLFTTSNGTRALHQARLGRQILVACLANLSATLTLLKDVVDVDILCAGSNGSVTREDVIAAGAYVAELARVDTLQADDAALVAVDAFQAATRGLELGEPETADYLAESLAAGEHGRHLITLGYEPDLRVCAAVDSIGVVAQFEPHSGLVVQHRT